MIPGTTCGWDCLTWTAAYTTGCFLPPGTTTISYRFKRLALLNHCCWVATVATRGLQHAVLPKTLLARLPPPPHTCLTTSPPTVLYRTTCLRHTSYLLILPPHACRATCAILPPAANTTTRAGFLPAARRLHHYHLLAAVMPPASASTVYHSLFAWEVINLGSYAISGSLTAYQASHLGGRLHLRTATTLCAGLPHLPLRLPAPAAACWQPASGRKNAKHLLYRRLSYLHCLDALLRYGLQVLTPTDACLPAYSSFYHCRTGTGLYTCLLYTPAPLPAAGPAGAACLPLRTQNATACHPAGTGTWDWIWEDSCCRGPAITSAGTSAWFYHLLPALPLHHTASANTRTVLHNLHHSYLCYTGYD